MPESIALSHFKSSAALAEGLMKIERENYSNPPKVNERTFVNGLRGGAVVLMVGSFESYLRQAFLAHLGRLSVIPPPVEFQKLPEKLRINSVFLSLERAAKGPQFDRPKPRPKKADRLPGIAKAASLIVSGFIDPECLSWTNGNPDSDTIKQLFTNIGLKDPFGTLRPSFDKKWAKQESHTFVVHKLDEIVNRRHKVAHTADALDITRSELKDSLRFLTVLSEVIDGQLDEYISKLISP